MIEAAIWVGVFGLADVADRGLQKAAVHLTRVAAAALPFAYLLFVGTLPSPLARPLRTRAATAAFGIGLMAVLALGFFWPEGFTVCREAASPCTPSNGPIAEPARIGIGVTSLIGLLVSVSMWRGAPEQTMTRRQGAAYALAFSIRDAGLVTYLVLLYGSRIVREFPVASAFVHTYELAASFVLFYVVLAYGILKTQLFDIDLRLKSVIRIAVIGASLLLAFVLVAQFTIGKVPDFARYAMAAASAAVLIVAYRPLDRMARGIADRAFPGVEPSPGYLEARKQDVYRAAIESSPDEEDSPFLKDLRKRLDIGPELHRALLALVRAQAMMAPRARPRPSAYRVLRELGRGASGRTFLARSRLTGGQVVLKVPNPMAFLDDATKKRFRREADLLSRVQHPGVVRLEDLFESNGMPVLVMSFEPGGNLEERLRQGPMEVREALSMTRDLLLALEHVHLRGLVHRDVKPANIVFDQGGRPKLTDFGVAFARGKGQTTVTLLAAQGQPGSPAYMSPEQARGQDLDARSDLYALGAVLYECLTARHYLDLHGASDFEVRRRIQEDAPRIVIEHVPLTVRALLARTLAKEPGRRFQTAASMRRAVDRCLGVDRGA